MWNDLFPTADKNTKEASLSKKEFLSSAVTINFLKNHFMPMKTKWGERCEIFKSHKYQSSISASVRRRKSFRCSSGSNLVPFVYFRLLFISHLVSGQSEEVHHEVELKMKTSYVNKHFTDFLRQISFPFELPFKKNQFFIGKPFNFSFSSFWFLLSFHSQFLVNYARNYGRFKLNWIFFLLWSRP